MAAKSKEDRTLYRPVISSDVMGNRNVEVRAVEAWVQPAHFYNEEHSAKHEAVLSAQLEETKMQLIKASKDAKLKQFQEDVRRRVRHESLVRQKELHERSCQKQLECEQRLIHHQGQTQRGMFGDVCYNKVFTHNYMQPEDSACAILDDPVSNLKTVDINIAKRPTGGMVDVTLSARHKLSQKQVFTKHYSEQTTDACTSPDAVPFDRCDDDNSVNLQQKKCVTFNIDEQVQNTTVPGHTVHPKDCEGHVTQKTRTLSDHQRSARDAEDEKRQQVLQLSLCRRVYMDMEREGVKENLRLKQHHSNIQKLKAAKELERLAVEELSAQAIEPVDPVCGESVNEIVAREQFDLVVSVETMRVRSEKMQKLRETERYTKALKERLKERAERQGVHIPPLCFCSDTVWDTSPYTCANNCVFYQNPKEFSKVLQSLLKSLDLAR